MIYRIPYTEKCLLAGYIEVEANNPKAAIEKARDGDIKEQVDTEKIECWDYHIEEDNYDIFHK